MWQSYELEKPKPLVNNDILLLKFITDKVLFFLSFSSHPFRVFSYCSNWENRIVESKNHKRYEGVTLTSRLLE